MKRSTFVASCVVVVLALSQFEWTAAAAPRRFPAPTRSSLGIWLSSIGAPGRTSTPLLPLSLDADGDGWMDLVEVLLGSDPANAAVVPEHLAIPESCMNAADDDADGATDEKDADCRPPELERTTLPPAGVDAFDSTMELDGYALATPLGVCPLDFNGGGPAIVERAGPVDLGGGLRGVATEMVAMQLVGTGTLAPGSPCNPGPTPTSFPATIVEDPTQDSTGNIADTNPDAAKDFPADSSFDAFFLVDTPLGLLPGGPPGGPAGTAVNVTNVIRSIPPYHTPGNPKLNPDCYSVAGLPHQHCPKPPLDHFKCYTGKFSDFQASVLLKDQFGQEQVQVLKPNRFCNPVSKNKQGIFDDGGHLKRYRILPSAPFQPVDVLVQNQFGLQQLTVVEPTGLFVPSRKDKLAQPAALDHFKCYEVQGAAVNKRVRLEDQFDVEDGRIERARVLQPVTLCTPVEKTVDGVTTPIGDPTMHLVCYVIETGSFQPRTVVVKNQFGKEKVRVRRPVELCAPSLKTVVPGIEVDVFPDSFAQVHIQTQNANEVVNLTGPTTVEVDLGALADTDGDGLEQVPTEITELNLQGTSQLFGPITIRLRPASSQPGQASTGEIEELQNLTPGVLDVPPFTQTGQAASFFNVFVEVVVVVQNQELVLHNNVPKRLTAVITHKPPDPGEVYQSPEVVDLFDQQNNPTGVQLGPAIHVPNPG